MDGTETAVTKPEITIYSGENTLSVGTSVQPFTVEVEGRIKQADS